MTGATIEARGLEKRFGSARALCGLDLAIPAGTSLAVLGPNGAGKSTLLRLIAGVARPSAGSLEIDGRRAGEPRARARVGFIGHSTFLYPELTARENLLFAARLHGAADAAARVERLLDEEGLGFAADRAARGFSRGTAQRVAIARGLVHDPPVVLLDEPYTGLDREAAERLTERIARLRRDGRTLVLVTHDLAAARSLADAAIALVGGRVAHRSQGAPLDLGALEQAACEAPRPRGAAR